MRWKSVSCIIDSVHRLLSTGSVKFLTSRVYTVNGSKFLRLESVTTLHSCTLCSRKFSPVEDANVLAFSRPQIRPLTQAPSERTSMHFDNGGEIKQVFIAHSFNSRFLIGQCAVLRWVAHKLHRCSKNLPPSEFFLVHVHFILAEHSTF